jgi:hypothetical protein
LRAGLRCRRCGRHLVARRSVGLGFVVGHLIPLCSWLGLE